MLYLNKSRLKASESVFHKQDRHDLPIILNLIRRKGLDKLRAADRNGQLNEFYGPEEIVLEEEESHGCRSVVLISVQRFLESIRLVFRGVRPGDLDIENEQDLKRALCAYKFDLGSRARYFATSAVAESPDGGNVLTYKIKTTSGTELDVLEVDVPDVLPFKILNRDVQAQVLCEKTASLIWIFEKRTQVFLVAESSSSYVWRPQQWFRKILCDLTLSDSIMICNPLYWHPIVRQRLMKAITQFKKMFKTINDSPRVRQQENELDADIGPFIYEDRDQIQKTDSTKYKLHGKECAKVMEYFPHTRTRIVVGNFSAELVNRTNFGYFLGGLHEDWKEYCHNVRFGIPFIPLKQLAEKEIRESGSGLHKVSVHYSKYLPESRTEVVVTEPKHQTEVTYKNLFLKPFNESMPGIFEICKVGNGSDKNLNSSSSHVVDDPEHVPPQRGSGQDEFQVIKSAEDKCLPKPLREMEWKESASDSNTGCSRNHSRQKTRGQKRYLSGKGTAHSEGYLGQSDNSRGSKRSPRSNVDSNTFDEHSRPGPSRKSGGHRKYEGNSSSSDSPPIAAHNSNESGGYDKNENVLKLGLSKTRQRIEHPTMSETEFGPQVPTYSEPNVLQESNFEGETVQQIDLGSDIPPADAESLSALAPHALSSRVGFLGVVDQLGLETPSFPSMHGHINVQQHRCGSGSRNTGNSHGAYHAVTYNKSLESLDLGQTSSRSNRSLGKNNGKRSHVLDNPPQ